MTCGRLHSIETLGTGDGQGIRTVFFLIGCPLRCAYCHNPDTWDGDGKEITPEEVLRTAKRYKDYYADKGGVTFSGGEPLAQAEFVVECAEILKADGINITLDTAGFTLTEEVKKVLLLCDEILLDIKHTDFEIYHNLTKSNLQTALDTLDFLKKNGKRVVIRQVIVPGISDGEDNIRRLYELAGIYPVELLAYHTLGEHKWENLGLMYTLKGVKPPTKEALDRLKALKSILKA